ncbi:MAG: hypothetical protein IID16_00940 [Candidatus Marinimicrobia bacterium]|nr:hypothetical protein [Candidatus Neomarinimicrobiota bacterium]
MPEEKKHTLAELKEKITNKEKEEIYAINRLNRFTDHLFYVEIIKEDNDVIEYKLTKEQNQNKK